MMITQLKANEDNDLKYRKDIPDEEINPTSKEFQESTDPKKSKLEYFTE